MVRRIAASMALVAFALCILVGMQAGNPFASVVSKALLALAATFALGLVVGGMAQKMLDENLAPTRPWGPTTRLAEPEAAADSSTNAGAGGR